MNLSIKRYCRRQFELGQRGETKPERTIVREDFEHCPGSKCQVK